MIGGKAANMKPRSIQISRALIQLGIVEGPSNPLPVRAFDLWLVMARKAAQKFNGFQSLTRCNVCRDIIAQVKTGKDATFLNMDGTEHEHEQLPH